MAATDLVNLTLALAVADPITAAPSAVARYRNLRSCSPFIDPRNVGELMVLLGGSVPEIQCDRRCYLTQPGAIFGGIEPLGNALERFVEVLAIDKKSLAKFEAAEFRVSLRLHSLRPKAEIRFFDATALIQGPGFLYQPESGTAPEDAGAAEMRRTVSLPIGIFSVLADLLAHSWSQLGTQPAQAAGMKISGNHPP